MTLMETDIMLLLLTVLLFVLLYLTKKQCHVIVTTSIPDGVCGVQASFTNNPMHHKLLICCFSK